MLVREHQQGIADPIETDREIAESKPPAEQKCRPRPSTTTTQQPNKRGERENEYWQKIDGGQSEGRKGAENHRANGAAPASQAL